MTKIILDTNILVALLDKNDVWHAQAVSLRDALIKEKTELIFLDCVAIEAITVLGRRCERNQTQEAFHTLAKQFEDLVNYHEMTWSYLMVKEQYKDILNDMKKHQGKISFHDTLISRFAKQNQITHIASFDKDFDTVESLVRIKNKADLSTT